MLQRWSRRSSSTRESGPRTAGRALLTQTYKFPARSSTGHCAASTPPSGICSVTRHRAAGLSIARWAGAGGRFNVCLEHAPRYYAGGTKRISYPVRCSSTRCVKVRVATGWAAIVTRSRAGGAPDPPCSCSVTCGYQRGRQRWLYASKGDRVELLSSMAIIASKSHVPADREHGAGSGRLDGDCGGEQDARLEQFRG